MFLIKNVHDKESLIGLLSEFGPSSIVLVFSFINYYLEKKKAMESIARKVYFNNFVFSCTFVLRPACLQSIPDFKNKNQT